MNVYSYQCGKVRKWRFDKRVRGVRLQGKGFRTRAEATDELQKRVEAEKQKIGTDFLRLCREYLDYSETAHTAKTFKYKRTTVQNFLGHYGRTAFPDSRHILVYLLHRAKTVSANAYNADRKELGAMFSWGIKHGYVYSNPVAKTDKMGWRKSVRYIPPIEDINAVLLVSGHYRDLLETCLYTLGRKSEILKLTWEDIDFERNTIRLWTRKRKDGADEYDDLPMPSPLRRVLQLRYTRRNKSELWVFPNRYPTSRSDGSGRFSQLSNVMSRLCRKAGVKPFTFHALRHYGASYLERRGVDLGTIQKLLRHKNINTTRLYLHTLSEDVKRGADVLGEIQDSATILRRNNKRTTSD